MSAATFALFVKKRLSDMTYVIEKEDTDIDKSEGASGVVVFDLLDTDTEIDKYAYEAELKVTFASGSIRKGRFRIEVLEGVE